MRIGLFTDSHYCNKEMLGEGRRPALGYERIENVINALGGKAIRE